VTRLERDGVGLHLEESGEGDTSLLLVHGIACDHRYMAAQVERFAPRHRVVAVDLRGHGRSDAPATGYDVETHVGDLVWPCDRLGLEHPVVVGHSLGGIVALALAARHPELPAAVVALDSPLLPPAERAALMRRFFPWGSRRVEVRTPETSAHAKTRNGVQVASRSKSASA
jgi:pimeloyl-ACP methyl ester carboxylesterase